MKVFNQMFFMPQERLDYPEMMRYRLYASRITPISCFSARMRSTCAGVWVGEIPACDAAARAVLCHNKGEW
jgi:hypothetical protein